MGKEKEEEANEKEFLKTLKFISEGYGGIDTKGKIVDRRIDFRAMPIPKNSSIGVPEPKEVNEFRKLYEERENMERLRLLNSGAFCSSCHKRINPGQANWRFKGTWWHIHSDGKRYPVTTIL